jgi:hypothetical protein
MTTGKVVRFETTTAAGFVSGAASSCGPGLFEVR